MRDVLLKKLKYTETTGVVASWLLYHDHCVRQYYSEHYYYNRDAQAHNLKN